MCLCLTWAHGGGVGPGVVAGALACVCLHGQEHHGMRHLCYCMRHLCYYMRYETPPLVNETPLFLYETPVLVRETPLLLYETPLLGAARFPQARGT